MDDGWFGQRNSDTEGLGDWYPNLDKLPSGISGLSQKINDMGLKFGIWIEPEMTNKNSKFFKEHQDWVLHVPKRPISQGRNQYVVDYSNDQAVDYIYQMLEKVISESHISYIKWDMNRMLSEVYSLNTLGHLQGKVMHKYVLGVYNLYERLIDKFPEILIESCSAGGNRFDAGMLYYAPMAWASDNTDAVERLKIQYGSSLVYPLSSMGSHVSEVPNYLMNRNVSLETRVNVACFGSYGYELDPTTMSDEDIKKLSEYTAIVKKYRKIIQFGDLYRLKSPFSSNTVVWMVVSKDRKMALVGYYRILEKTNSGYERVKLQGLDPNYKYHVSINEYDCYGDELMNYGLITSDHSSGVDLSVNEPFGDYISKIYVIEKCK